MAFFNGVEITGMGANGLVNIDEELSTESTNPVQNKVIAEEFNNILGGLPSDSSNVEFGVRKLKPNDTFELEPNMFVFVATGGETCLGYYNFDGTAVDTGLGTALFFSTETNSQADDWGTDEDFKWWYRIGCLYQTSGSFLSIPFTGRNDALRKNAYIQNRHSSLSVYAYYIKQK